MNIAANLSARPKLKIAGPDAQRYLNGQVTNDVSAIPEGEALYACITTAKGKLEADIFITKENDTFYVDGPEELGDELLTRLDRYLIADDAEWESLENLHLIHLIGETFDGPCLMQRATNRLGIAGTDIWCESLPDLPYCSKEIWEQARITQGIPRWGKELTGDRLPQEARLEDRAISFEKGCYIGQEVISRIKSVGKVNKLLCRFVGEKIAPGWRIRKSGNEKECGFITSVCPVPGKEVRQGLGYVTTSALEDATSLEAFSNENNLFCAVEIRNTPG